jgi:hypothetical protein
MYDAWDSFCDTLEEGDTEGSSWKGWISKNFLRRLSIEAPVIV